MPLVFMDAFLITVLSFLEHKSGLVMEMIGYVPQHPPFPRKVSPRRKLRGKDLDKLV
ncbi:MAG: hypothetical protein HQ454_05500 [Acidimicrobiaceae bacterium]|nr:hypothetical protein [Acidimicrobiaceae bacterium]